MGVNVGALIFYQNLITSTGISAGSAEAAFPATNAASLDLFAKWRSTSSTGANNYLEYNFGSTAPGNIDGVMAIGLNLGDTGTWRVRFDNSTAYTSTEGDPVYDSASVAAFDVSYGNPLSWQPPAGRDAIHLPSSTAATGWPNQYLRVDFANSTAAGEDAYVEGSLLWAGPSWKPATNYDLGWERGFITRGSRTLRTVTLSFHRMTPAEAAELTNTVSELAQRGRVYLVVQSTEDATWLSEAMLCTVSLPRVITVDYPNQFRQASVTFTEADF